METQWSDFQRQLSQLIEASAENRAEHKAFRHRLEELEAGSRRQNEILLTLQRQADAIESINRKIDRVAGSVDAVAGRVREIEREPAEKWKKMGFEVIKYIVLAAAGAAIGYLMK